MLNTSATLANNVPTADRRRSTSLGNTFSLDLIGPRARGGRHAEDRGHRERHAPPDRRPRRLDPGASRSAITVSGTQLFSIRGGAIFSINQATGFKLQSFSVTGFKVGDNDDDTPPPTHAEAAAADRRRRAHRRARRVLEPVGKFIDVVFTDRSGTGLRTESILDAAPEFELTVNGVAIARRLRHAGRRRGQAAARTATSSRSIPPLGLVQVRFLPGSLLGQLRHHARHERQPDRGPSSS